VVFEVGVLMTKSIKIGIFKIGFELRHDGLMTKVKLWVRMAGPRMRAVERKIRAMRQK